MKGGDLMELLIRSGGIIHCVYSEDIELAQLGTLAIRRASHVEPDGEGSWTADLSPTGGPVLGPFRCRSEALRAELEWLNQTWLFVESSQ